MARVILIDDHDDSREVATALLAAHGFLVDGYASAEQALQRLREDPPEVLVTDVSLPGMSGVDLARTLRSEPQTSGVYVIALTGHSDLPKGAFDAVITKPFDPERFAKIVRTALEKNGSSPDISLKGPRETPSATVRAASKPVVVSPVQYRLLAEQGATMMWWSDSESKRSWFNERWLAFTGRTLAQEIGTGWTENVHADDLPRVLATLRSHFERGETFELEYRLRQADGGWRWIWERGVPSFDENRKLTGFGGASIDSDDRHRIDETKATFLRSMAHELRTPMTPLRAYLHQFRRLVARNELPTEDLVERMDRQLNRVVALVQNLSEAGRLASGGQLLLDLTEFDLGAVLARVVTEQRGLVESRKDAFVPTFEVGGIDVAVLVIGDEKQVEAAIAHVIANAVKFSPDGGAIEIRLLRTDRDHVIEVLDRGIGIPESDLPNVGKPYFRASNASPRNYAGVGLGLAIASEVMRAHGGAFEVQRRSGGGTRVALRFPQASERRA